MTKQEYHVSLFSFSFLCCCCRVVLFLFFIIDQLDEMEIGKTGKGNSRNDTHPTIFTEASHILKKKQKIRTIFFRAVHYSKSWPRRIVNTHICTTTIRAMFSGQPSYLLIGHSVGLFRVGVRPVFEYVSKDASRKRLNACVRFITTTC